MKLKQLLSILLTVVLLLSAMPTVGFAATTVSAGDSFTYTPSEHWGVTNDIWSWQWALSDTVNFSDMKFTNVSGQGDCYVANWNTYPYCAARNNGVNIHPNEKADAARVFTAPASGWVTVSVSVARTAAYELSAANSPTSFRILLEGTTVYPTKGQHQVLTSTTAEQITCKVFIKQGEKLRFVVGAMDDRTSDAVNMETTVRYDSVTTDPGEVCRVGEVFSYVKTAENFGLADPHWAWEWTPAGETVFSPMTFQYIEKYSREMYASDWTVRPYNYADQLGVKVHPAADADTVKTFTVPYTGTVKLDTTVARVVALSSVSSSAANGTSLRILVNNTQVYPLYSDELVLTTTTEKKFSVSLAVTEGDQIHIIIGSMGQTTSDAINMTNTVTYTSVDQPAVCVDDAETFAPSTAQWVNNKLGHWRFEWRDADDTFGDMTYQYVSATGSYLYTSDWSAHPYQYADLMGEKLSPAQNRDTVKTYTAPHDGRVQMDVRVARYNEYAAGGSATPTTLRIYKNNEQIWPTNGDAQQITSTSEVTYQVSADVRAGDRLRCVVGSMGDTTGDEIRMYNTVTYRAVGTRELAAVADQYNQRIDVIDLWGDNLDSAETAWSFKPTTALGYSSLDTFNSPTDAKIRYSQTLKKYVVAICSSRGFMGLVDHATGKKLWQVSLTDNANPHATEYLPNGNVAVAASKGNWVRVYTASQGSSSKTYAQATLEGAHGVLWDPDRQVLWALGFETITAYRIGGTDAKPTLTEATEYRGSIPNASSGGHDLSPVYGNKDRLWVSSETIYQYDIPSRTLVVDYTHAGAVARKGVKGISSFPDSQTLVHVYPNNTYLTHDSDRIFVTLPQDGKFFGVTHTHSSGAYYKVRSWISSYMPDPREEYDDSENEYVPEISHNYESQVTPPTCTLEGYTTYTCTICGDSYIDDEVPATGHNYKITGTPPTCAEGGYTTYTCSVCGDSYTISDPSLAEHSYKAVVTAPSCTEIGYTKRTCLVCGYSYTTNEVPALGHRFEYGKCTFCRAPDPDYNPDYYLFGYINGADYACEADAQNLGQYRFENGLLTATFSDISYVAVKTGDNANWYMTNGWVGENTTSATLYDTTANSNPDKLQVPANVELTFSLTKNDDGTLFLSYTITGCIHQYGNISTTSPTCTDPGSKVYLCPLCGDSYTESIPATGHSFSRGVCTVCGFQDVNYVAPDYYLVGYINGADYGCESDYENIGIYKFVDGKLVATFNQESYIFLKTGDNANWFMTQTYCTDTTAVYYDTTTGASEKMYVPGNVELTFTLTENDDGTITLSYTANIMQPTLTLKSPTLEFKDMITVNAFFTAENTQDVVEMGMITYSTKVTSWGVDTAEHIIPGAVYNESTGRYVATSQGIHAKYLGDTVYLAIYAKLSDGTYAYSKLAGYSPVQYATSQLKNSTDTKLKQLVVAMLNYGAEAQLYFGHNTGSLANATLTAAQKALPDAYRSDMVGSVPAAPAAKQGVFANNSGFSKRSPSISFEGAFCINYFFTPKYAPDSGITLYYWNETDYNAASVLTAANATGKFKLEGSGTGQYSGDIEGIGAKALSEAVYVAAAYKSGGTVWTSGVLGYSIGAYCSGQSSKGTAIAGLAEATAVYGYHAKAYFG